MSRFATHHRIPTLVLATCLASLWLGISLSTGASAADGQPVRIESAAAATPSAGLAPAVRIDAPAQVMVDAPVPVAQTSAPSVPAAAASIDGSTCRHDVPGATFTISIPDIGYSCPVQAGGQASLDSGVVTMIGDPAIQSALATSPGARGTVWIAGHRTSHGGAFADVPDLAIGALVVLADGSSTATYRVVAKTAFALRNDRVIDASGNATGEATLDAILRTDHGGDGSPRVVLQTCDGAAVRWMVYADLVTS